MSDTDPINANIAGHIAALGLHGFKVYRENAVISRDEHDHAIAGLHAENTRLRAALEELADSYEGFNSPRAMDWTPADDLIMADARKALKVPS